MTLLARFGLVLLAALALVGVAPGTALAAPVNINDQANVLDEAHSRRLPAFVVGPPPTADPERNKKIEELAGTFSDVCRRREVPFVDTFTPLLTHEDWLTDLAAGDGTHPRQAGYGLMAWLVLHGGWHEWLGIARP